jgi:hypothetical protein
MALGKPILTSDVSDARNLVEDGVNGFLFDPHSPESVANAISRFTALSPEEKTRMGRAGRAKAEVLFDLGTVADHYLRVLEVAAVGKVLRVEHWPEAVPDAAASRHPEPRNPLFGCGIQKAVHSAPKGGSRSSGASGRGH